MDKRQDNHPGISARHDAPDGLPPVDPDLALLESYLDGELSSGELQALQGRLSGDADLSGALARLSADYTVRQAVWSSLEGSNAESERMARVVGRSIRRAGFWQRSKNAIRVGAAVAACVTCFLAGWVGRGTTATAGIPQPPGETIVRSEPIVYQVALTDEAGNITDVARFDTVEEARDFAADLGQWQVRQAQFQNGQPVLRTSGL